MDTRSTRREFFKRASVVGMASLPLLPSEENDKGLNVICVGAHPDDPESGCGGTLARYAAAGHTVKIYYLTRGEAGIEGRSHAEASAIRTREAEEACKILGAAATFLGQIDGDTVVNSEWIDKFSSVIQREQPDVVFTHWPLDAHRDHQAAAVLCIQAWLRNAKKFQLYFYEVCQGEQTLLFRPTDYVDIGAQQEQKRKAVYCHVSQKPADIYSCGHEIMEKFRGMEAGVHAAEAFIRMVKPVGV